MHVIATAGHVDHGKSTLVQALTGSQPDRLVEERRRGLSIELGYCWMRLPGGAGDLAFVDVPGHERFVSTMLAGVGPVPAVLFVVAADDDWMPQAGEHLAALDAIGVRHGVLAVTRADLADPGPALRRAQYELASTSLRSIPAVAVSARTGAGMDELGHALVDLVGRLPQPDPTSDVRLWVDRCFHLSGAGTVVTGTLPEGSVAVGDHLALVDDQRGEQSVRVRSIETLNEPVRQVSGVARVALGLGGSVPAGLARGGVLVTPGAWLPGDTVDVGWHGRHDQPPPERTLLHIGAAAVSVRLRPLGPGLARLVLDRPLPLRVGDRALLRDSGSRLVWGVTVLDPAPPLLRRRGDARRRAAELAIGVGRPDLADELRRRGVTRVSLLTRIGVEVPADLDGLAIRRGNWLLPRDRLPGLRERLRTAVDEHDRARPLDPGITAAAAAQLLGLPTADLVAELVEAPLRFQEGRVIAAGAGLPPRLVSAVAALERDLADHPFAAPDAGGLAARGLDAKAVAAAARAGLLLKLADGIVLMPSAPALAAELLRRLPQPFTVSEARQALQTSRRVVLPLLAQLDRSGVTRRLPDDRRLVAPAASPPIHEPSEPS
ncbi:selenocysteine-specific translation elongation factor [Microlunatus panaciterrae]|uniref:Selenocysteine-specific elongation factor n=1 Tax=Microlunatus panaciterrae TaxID=400768 RepID=A0ABS2RH85_9ACTN|nr:selenocysteine-specific translation elongation factor [Microlunatus panaciterrae]MBM7798369.1 selenocysteine-specific elongation factor [Microlunatus panaciterrae]